MSSDARSLSHAVDSEPRLHDGDRVLWQKEICTVQSERGFSGDLVELLKPDGDTTLVPEPFLELFACAPFTHAWEHNTDPLGMQWYCPRCTTESMVKS